MADALMEIMAPGYENGVAGEYIVEAMRLLHVGILANNAAAHANIEASTGRTLTADEKTEFNVLYALKPAQLEIPSLAGLLSPSGLEDFLEAIADSPCYRWFAQVTAIFHAYQWPWGELDTPAEVRAALGLPTP